MEAQLRAPNIYKCVQSAPSIQCSGGTVQNNQCICPQGMESSKVSDRVYRCVKSAAPPPATTPQEQPTVTPSAPPPAATPSPPSITCTGGNVQNGQCVCPVGTRRQRTDTNAYRCVSIIQNPLQQIIPRLLQK